MGFNRLPRLILALGLLTLGGCSFWHHHFLETNTCNDRQAYASAGSIPPLKIPAGMSAPDTHAALRIPDLNEPAPPPRSRHDPCLDEPPSYVVPKPVKPPQA
jgi:hypothetical protein